jgi:hypothetical protein
MKSFIGQNIQNKSNRVFIQLIAGLVPLSAHGVKFYSSCTFFLEPLGGDE